MTDTELAYIAGVIDSDGCISIQQRKKQYHSLRIAVAMKSPTIPEWLKEMVGGSTTTYINNGKPLTMWVIYGQLAKDLCYDMLPYLIGKQKQAAVGLDVL